MTVSSAQWMRGVALRARAVGNKAHISVMCILFGLSHWVSAAEDGFIPERYDHAPRILFNLADSKANLVEIVPGELYQDFWQGVRMTVIRGNMRTKPGEESVFNFQPAYHGEEFVLLMEGRLTFTFPETGQKFTLHPGDVMHFNNVLHHGVCETAECQYLGILNPPFNRGGLEDYGHEGADPTKESPAKSDPR